MQSAERAGMIVTVRIALSKTDAATGTDGPCRWQSPGLSREPPR